MSPSPLAVRLSRRAIASAQVVDDVLAFADGRHLTSRADRAIAAVERYVRRLLDLRQPSVLVINVPATAPGASTDRIRQAVEALSAERRIPVVRVTRPELLVAYGATPLRSRQELRDVVRVLWPELTAMTVTVEPYIADAAAAALYAECESTFRGASP